MRHTRAHTKNRRSHHKLKANTIANNESGVPHLRHRASLETGTYRGKEVIDIVKKAGKKAKKSS